MKSEKEKNHVSLRQAASADDEFAYQVKKEALGPYVTQVWGWDENVQRDFHRKEFDPSHLQIVTLGGRDIGTIEVVSKDKRILINKLYLLPKYHNRGIGSKLIRDVLDQARTQGLPVRLSVLKVNPARRLYERLGFHVVEETDTHWKMEWPS